MRRAGGQEGAVVVGVALLLAAGAAVAAPPAAAPPANAEPCKLQTERDAIVDDFVASVRREGRRLAGRPPEPDKGEWKVWLRVPYQASCVDLALRWLVDTTSDDNRVAAAAWLWLHRYGTDLQPTNHLFRFPAELWRKGTWRELPLTPEMRRQWLANAAREKHPIVLRLQLAQLERKQLRDEARALIRAGLGRVGHDPALADLALDHWLRPDAPPLTRAERDLVWGMRHGVLAAKARHVLSLMRDPEWVAELDGLLRRTADKAPLYELASLAGLAPRVAPEVLAEARAAIAQARGDCFFLKDRPRRLSGAGVETLALAELFLACKDKLRKPWSELVRAASLAPDADRALVRLARLQRQHGEPQFWVYADELVDALARQRTDAAVDGLLEVAHMCQGFGTDGPVLWRVVEKLIGALRGMGTPRAGDGLVKLARLAAGLCEDDRGSCLWRIGKELRAAVKAIGGPEEQRRLRELAKIRPLPRRQHPPRWTPPAATSPGAPASPASP